MAATQKTNGGAGGGGSTADADNNDAALMQADDRPRMRDAITFLKGKWRASSKNEYLMTDMLPQQDGSSVEIVYQLDGYIDAIQLAKSGARPPLVDEICSQRFSGNEQVEALREVIGAFYRERTNIPIETRYFKLDP